MKMTKIVQHNYFLLCSILSINHAKGGSFLIPLSVIDSSLTCKLYKLPSIQPTSDGKIRSSIVYRTPPYILTTPSRQMSWSSINSYKEPNKQSNAAEEFDPFSWKQVTKILDKNFFLLGVILAIVLARLIPQIGCNGSSLHPEIFIGQYGVAAVFLLSGLSLEFNQLTAAASNLKLNTLVQLVTFLAWPLLVGIPIRRMLQLMNILPKSIIDGILITTCLPTTINMCILLSRASGGNVASAIWNAVVSNTAGILITPGWLLYFFGAVIELPFVDMIGKLSKKVLLPIAIGQALRRKKKVQEFYMKNSKLLKRFQEIILLSILWNSFCNSFTQSNVTNLQFHHALILIAILAIMHSVALFTTFGFFTSVKGLSRADAVSAMFCSSHKTMAFGLPLISTVFEGNPLLSSYCAPIIIIHPIQAAIGSFLVPKLSEYTQTSTE
jgi:solute carrier family 10 (sodium/bile acid cotransporter), member 7